MWPGGEYGKWNGMRESTYRDLVGVTQSVLQYVQDNLDRPLDVNTLASVAGFSPFHFQRSFYRIVGETPINHVRRIRLERAAYQLLTSQDTISWIADDAGFGSLAAFSRAFEAAFSVPPTGYRSSRWLHYWQSAPSAVHFDPDARVQFKPLARRGTPSEARLERIPEFNVLAMRHEGPVQYARTWQRFYEWLDWQGIDRSGCQPLSFTCEPKEPSKTWRVRGYVSIATDQSVPTNESVNVHRIAGGNYLVKRHRGPPHLLPDFWARAWFEDIWELGVRPRNATAFNVFVDGIELASPEDFVSDIYLPIQEPASLTLPN